MPHRKNELAKGIFILVAIAVAAVILIVQQTTKVVVKKERQQIVESTTYTQTATEGYISLAQEGVSQLAENAQLAGLATDKGLANLQRGSAILTAAKNNMSSIEKLGLYDTSGVLLAENTGTDRTLGNEMPKQDFFATVLKTKSVVMSRAIKSPISGKQTMVIAVPLQTNNKMWGVLTGLVNFSQLREFFVGIQAGNGYTTITDQNGGTLLDTRQEQTTSPDTGKGLAQAGQKQGVYEATDSILNQKVTRSYQAGPQITSIVTKTNKEVYELSRRVLYIIIIAGVAINLTLDTLFGAYVIRTSGRLNDLILVVKSINKGGTVASVDPKELERKDDIGELAQEVDKLIKIKQQ